METKNTLGVTMDFLHTLSLGLTSDVAMALPAFFPKATVPLARAVIRKSLTPTTAPKTNNTYIHHNLSILNSKIPLSNLSLSLSLSISLPVTFLAQWAPTITGSGISVGFSLGSMSSLSLSPPYHTHTHTHTYMQCACTVGPAERKDIQQLKNTAGTIPYQI